MKISQDVRNRFALPADQIAQGMAEKSRQFVELGSSVYLPASHTQSLTP